MTDEPTFAETFATDGERLDLLASQVALLSQVVANLQTQMENTTEAMDKMTQLLSRHNDQLADARTALRETNEP